MQLSVYGFGNRGRDVIDQLLSRGHQVTMIFDKSPSEETYKSIPVRSLLDPEAQEAARQSPCVIALHNSYVNIREVNESLVRLGCATISLANAHVVGLELRIDSGFWLNPSSPYFLITEEDQAWMFEHLADIRSREVFSEHRAYRSSGDIARSPDPSTFDEYTPHDLPRYTEPLRLMDCGAYTGVAYRKFARQYNISKYVAFEPDPKNFKLLCNSEIQCQDTLLLPIGVWGKTEVLRFSGGKDMGSNVDNYGESLIQCVAVDDVLPSTDINLIKFDVEGAELAALQGMKQLIAKNRPSLCVSVYHRPEDLVVIPRLIQSWGLDYCLYLRTHEYNCFGTVLYARPR